MPNNVAQITNFISTSFVRCVTGTFDAPALRALYLNGILFSLLFKSVHTASVKMSGSGVFRPIPG